MQQELEQLQQSISTRIIRLYFNQALYICDMRCGIASRGLGMPRTDAPAGTSQQGPFRSSLAQTLAVPPTKAPTSFKHARRVDNACNGDSECDWAFAKQYMDFIYGPGLQRGRLAVIVDACRRRLQIVVD